jgi:prophage regulatory protein
MTAPADRILRKPETMHRVGLSDPTIWRLERAGKFPKRIKLGGNSVGWFESEIVDWLEAKKAER